MMEEQWSEVANGNLLQRRFPMITKFFNWNWLFGNNLYIISTGSGSGACLTPIFRFQALAKSSTNILAARTRTRLIYHLNHLELELGFNHLNHLELELGFNHLELELGKPQPQRQKSNLR